MKHFVINDNYGVSFKYNYLDKVLKMALKKEKVNNAYFSVIFVGEEEILDINKIYRGIDKVTDVISFAFEDNGVIENKKIRALGDIYICIPRAEEQAREYGHSIKRELSFLSVHGLLHLLGYDHMKKEEEEVMFKRQELILNEAGITR
mgnify:CR=1 FL=1